MIDIAVFFAWNAECEQSAIHVVAQGANEQRISFHCGATWPFGKLYIDASDIGDSEKVVVYREVSLDDILFHFFSFRCLF